MNKAERINHFLGDKAMIPILQAKIKEHEDEMKYWNKKKREYQKGYDEGGYMQLTSKIKRKYRMSDVTFMRLMAESENKKHMDAIERYRKYILRCEGGHTKLLNNKYDAERIKEEVLISDLMPDSPKTKSSTRETYICPLHNEKTASLTVYLKENTFHCFGCQAGTSVIDLYMQLNNVDFAQACKELSNLYM